MNTQKVTLEGLVSGEDLDKAYRKRRAKYVYKTVVKQDLQPFFDKGWEKIRSRSKKSFRLRKLKDIGPSFENEVWCTFKRMGFNEMNRDNKFYILRFDTSLTKQIDVFAKDDQCVCIVECKAAKKPHTKQSLGKDIDQLAAIQPDIKLSVLSHYKKKKMRVLWILATKNIDVNENDFERAEQAEVKILDDIQYYSDLSTHFGHSSKYQFLADMLPPGAKIPDLIEPVAAIKGRMGKEVFYSFVMEPEKLLKIAYIAHRGKTNEEDIDTYQRMAKKSRLNKIAQYIHDKKGIFPTSIVINLETNRPLRFDPASSKSITAGENAVLGTLYIPNKYKTAWIIDGQHRLFAYSDLEEAKTATLPVIAFENLDPDVQANLFVDINGEQVKVSKSLLIDLWATLHWNSDNPGEQLKALTSRLVKELDEHPRSPLRDRIINMGGRRTKTKNITLTALAEEIRKRQLLGYVHSRKSKEITHGPLFMDDLDSTLARAREIISGYLNNYINHNENLRKQWEVGGGEGGYICTNSGLIALLRILYAILNHLEHVDHLDIKTMKSSELLDRIWKYQKFICQFLGSASSNVIHEFRSRHGEAGFRACTFALLWETNKVYNNFDPQGLQQWIQSQDKANNHRAYDIYSKIETEVMNYITNCLKEEFGKDISQWWHEGVPEKIRVPAMQRAQNDGEYYHPEKYVDFIDWKEIISKSFDLLGDVFTIDAKPNDSRKKKLTWLVKVNEIRRIVTHPPRGGVSDAQLEYLIRIHEELIPRLKNEVE